MSILQHQTTPESVIPYELRLSQDRVFAEQDSDLYFTRRNLVFKTLDRICNLLVKLNVPYTIIGALALFEHGYRRFTDNVDLLISKDDTETLRTNFIEHGFELPFITSNSIRDLSSGVRIDFHYSGDLPGQGNAIPFKFPEPMDVPSDRAMKNYADLATLINLKLAAGHGDVCYNRHFVDILELIKSTKLPLNIVHTLHEFVRPKYRELWNQFRSACKYVQYFDPDAPGHVQKIEKLSLDGLISLPNKPGLWMTTDPELAIKYDMHDVDECDSDYHFPGNN